jgi:hypothetical protein
MLCCWIDVWHFIVEFDVFHCIVYSFLTLKMSFTCNSRETDFYWPFSAHSNFYMVYQYFSILCNFFLFYRPLSTTALLPVEIIIIRSYIPVQRNDLDGGTVTVLSSVFHALYAVFRLGSLYLEYIGMEQMAHPGRFPSNNATSYWFQHMY